MYRNGFITSWPALLQAIETRFAPSFYDDPRGALFKLVQRGTVADYLTEFERLANRIVGLSPPLLLSCFISGLTPEIRREVQAFQPISVPQATALARLQEDKLNDRRKYSKPTHTSHPAFSSLAPTHPPTQPAQPKQPFIQRTQEDMALRRERGLCYNCEEKWNPSHRCKGKVLFFIANTDDPSSSDIPLPEPSSHSAPTTLDNSSPTFDQSSLHPHVSLHAMADVPATDTFRLYSTINNKRITILVDSGSTHNFMQPRVAKFLNLQMQDTTPLRVMVGNGSVLDCRHLCRDTRILIQDHTFVVTLRVLSLSGADAVL